MGKHSATQKPKKKAMAKKATAKKATAKKATAKKVSAKKTVAKKVIKESSDIGKFIEALSTEKYAQANKYLVNIIETKISDRISSSLDEPLF
jgi:hypothetical protein